MGNTALKNHYATAEKTGVLNLSQGKLQDFPQQLKQLQGVLRTLDLSSNKFTSLPPALGSFSLLKSLNLDRNSLTRLPLEIGNLTRLEHLSVAHNNIESLPESVSCLINLKRVDLSHNSLEEFPLQLCGLKHLDVADLSNNKIASVPEGVSTLYVTELVLNRNQISFVVDEIADCPKLKTLRMEENCLHLNAFPLRLLSDSKVSMLSVDGNLFDSKSFMNLEGYDKYMERYTAVKKKLF